MPETSSSITDIAYDEMRKVLTVTFTGGVTMTHGGVPAAIHRALEDAENRPRFYAEHIRDHYRRT